MDSNKLLHNTEVSSTGDPLLILHGLFGSSRNWESIAQSLRYKWHSYLLDLRNHGSSFWDKSHTIQDLSQDVYNWLQHNPTIKSPVLMGHSMGGLAVCNFALNYATIPRAIIIIDIAPKNYDSFSIHNRFQNEFNVLKTDLAVFNTRAEIDTVLKQILPNDTIRNFLKMNIAVDEKTLTYYWKLNVETLSNIRAYSHFKIDRHLHYNGPTLFIKGGKSAYITEDDTLEINHFFPNAIIKTIENAGHWPHYGNSKDEFLDITTTFLNSL